MKNKRPKLEKVHHSVRLTGLLREKSTSTAHVYGSILQSINQPINHVKNVAVETKKRWRDNERKQIRMRERDLYVGYCSLTAPLLNFKQEPWAEQRRADEWKGRKDRESAGRENEQRANTGGYHEAGERSGY